jgi:hypothetical protein
MPMVCTICTSKHKESVNTALVDGASKRRIATQHGFSESAVRRHAAAHLPTAMVKAQDAADVAHGDDLLAEISDLQADARRIGHNAEQAGDARTALAAVGQLVKIVELLARLRGEIDDRPQVNLFMSPQWTAALQVVLVALEPYPDARIAVADRLAGLES